MKAKILLVDDGAADCCPLASILDGLNQSVVRARSGDDALRLLGVDDFAVIVLEIEPLGQIGFGTAKQLQQHSRHTPMILVLPDQNDFAEADTPALGAVDCWVKPLSPDLVRAKVAHYTDIFLKKALTASPVDRSWKRVDPAQDTGDMISTLDRELRFTHVNDRWAAACRIGRDACIGHRWQDVFPDSDGHGFAAELHLAFVEQRPGRFISGNLPDSRSFETRILPSRDGLTLLTTEVAPPKKAETSRRLLEAIVASSRDAVIAMTMRGGITSWNAGAERLFGYTADEIIGRNAAILEACGGMVDGPCFLDRVKRGERVELAETKQRTRDGRVVDVALTVSPILDDDGRPVGACTIARDITVRKRTELRQHVLAETGRILSSSLDYETTLTNVCQFVVPLFADWCALNLLTPSGEFVQLDCVRPDSPHLERASECWRRYPPRANDDTGVARVLRTGEPVFVPEVNDAILVSRAYDADHLRVLRATGLRSIIRVPMTARGRTLGVMSLHTADSGHSYQDEDLQLAVELGIRAGLAVDNARLFSEAQEAARQREEVLRLHIQMEERLMLLAEASGTLSDSPDLRSVLDAILVLSRRLIAADAYAVWKHDASTESWNITSSSGLSDEYQRTSVMVLDQPPGNFQDPVFAEDVREHPVLANRLRLYEQEGIRSILALALRVHGTISGTLVFYYRTPHKFNDVEIRLGTALASLAGSAIGNAELFEELRVTDRRKDEFLAMLAHELRNPLAAISNAVEVEKRTRPGDDRKWNHDVIEKQVTHLARLIDDLLDVARITRGTVRLQKQVVSAESVVASAVEMVRPLIEERRHKLVVDVGSAPMSLLADPTRLEQVLVNLLNNAAKYTDPGGRITIRAGIETGEVVIRVGDNGAGMTPELMARAFDLFSQGDRSIARSEGGLGLGLTIVKSMVEMIGGTVVAMSAGPGRGSHFTLRLPMAERLTEPPRLPKPPSSGKRSSKILVVEDNLDTARGMVRFLGLMGHEVRVAHDGLAALEEARSYRPEIILLDLGLPYVDGFEVARTLRNEGLNDAMIIAVSGYSEEQFVGRSRASGIDHHLVKPVNPDALIALIGKSV